LLHGLTASPKQFERFGRLLFERGHNVHIPRLPHHGYADRMTTALARLTAGELKATALDALGRARELGEEITVVGFSAGGTVAAWIAQTQAVEHAVVIAPFLGSLWIPQACSQTVARWADALPNLFIWWDPVKRERQMPEHGYPRYATHAVVAVYRLGAEVLRAAKDAPPSSARVIVVVNQSETTCNNHAIARLHAAWQGHAPERCTLVRLTGLPPSHDIIEPERRAWSVERIYPKLLELC
jgi:pimeloyl-ACP methyl ester carboxylesterase